MRIIHQHEHDLISPQEWADFLALDNHQADIRKEQGQWKGFTGLINVIMKLSDTKLPFDLVHQITCTIMTNALPLHDATRSRMGEVLHPLLARINNGCIPNAFLRTDVSPAYSPASAPSPLFGSMSVHALRPIASGEEVTIALQDAGYPTALRQAEFQGRYFFTCSCPLCTSPGLSSIEEGSFKVAFSLVTEALDLSPEPMYGVSKVLLGYHAALTAWAQSAPQALQSTLGDDPSFHIRYKLMNQLHGSLETRFDPSWQSIALNHFLVLMYRNPATYADLRKRPCNMEERYKLFHRAEKLTSIVRTHSLTGGERNVDWARHIDLLENFSMMLLDELEEDLKAIAQVVGNPGPGGSGAMVGLIEMMVLELIDNVKADSRRIAWSRYQVNKHILKPQTMIWVEGQIEGHLDQERRGRHWSDTIVTSVHDAREQYLRKKAAIENESMRRLGIPSVPSERDLQQSAVAHARGEPPRLRDIGHRLQHSVLWTEPVNSLPTVPDTE